MNKKKTAFLVIPGIGRQRPLDGMDAFTRGIVAALQNSFESDEPAIGLSNHLPAMAGNADSFVRIEATGSQPIDVYEYYWADKGLGQASLGKILEWLIEASRGAKEFYEAHPDLTEDYDRPIARAMRNGLMATNWYLSRMGGLFKAVALVDQVFPADYWIRLASVLKVALLPILGFVHKDLANFLQDCAAELVAYSSRGSRNRSREARDAILTGILDRLRSLVESPENYDQIVIASHSLGSVMAYDAINRLILALNIDPNLEDPVRYRKVAGLVTFGSPLDKVAFFFRFHPDGNDYVRRQLLDQRHSFDLRFPNTGGGDEPSLASPYRIRLDEHIRWINYWDAEDFISGHLDFYRVGANVECEMHVRGTACHLAYWNYLPMYQDICRRFLGLRSDN